MLEYLKGPITNFSDSYIIVEVGGFGVKVTVTRNTIEKLKSNTNVEAGHLPVRQAGAPSLLKTYLHISENKWEIFGFLEDREREAFLLLLGCRGVGTKAAINILNSFPPARLRQIALGQEPVTTLQQAPGIGAKSADRILVELKEKLPEMRGWSEGSDKKAGPATQYDHDDLYRALKNLGYRNTEIQNAIANSPTLPKTLSEAVKQLLKVIGKR